MRRFFTVGAALLVVVTGLVAGPGVPGAKAGAGFCKDGWPSTTEVVTAPAYVAVETLASPSYLFVGMCIADQPLGTQPLVFSGFVGVHANKTGPDTWRVHVQCSGDPTATRLVTADCDGFSYVTATPSTAPGLGLTASAVSTVEGINASLGTTGANTGGLGTTSGSNPTVTYGGTCVTAAGITPPIGTRCSSSAIETKVAAGDLTPGSGPSGTALCFVRDSGGNCVVGVPKASVILFKDAANPTEVSVLGTPVLNDPGPLCVGLC